VGHGRSNSFDRMIALEPFRRSASGRNKLPTYLPIEWIGCQIRTCAARNSMSHVRSIVHLHYLVIIMLFFARRHTSRLGFIQANQCEATLAHICCWFRHTPARSQYININAPHQMPDSLSFPNNSYVCPSRFNGSMPLNCALVPLKRGRSVVEEDPATTVTSSPQPPWKRVKRPFESQQKAITAFWDSLSHVSLTRHALKEHNRRNRSAVGLDTPAPENPSDSGTGACGIRAFSLIWQCKTWKLPELAQQLFLA